MLKILQTWKTSYRLQISYDTERRDQQFVSLITRTVSYDSVIVLVYMCVAISTMYKRAQAMPILSDNYIVSLTTLRYAPHRPGVQHAYKVQALSGSALPQERHARI